MNSPSVVIEIVAKNSASASKKHIQHLLKVADLKDVDCVRVAPIFRLEGNLAEADVQSIAAELLCDAIVEDYAVNSLPSDALSCFSDIWYKPGVTDPVGDSIVRAVKDFKSVPLAKAYSGTRYEFKVKSNHPERIRQVADFTTQQLLNPLVQECKIVQCK